MLYERVNYLMDSLGMKGADIARYADVAQTRVSKLRSGAENPGHDSSAIRQFAYGVLRLGEETGKTQTLYNLIGLRQLTDDTDPGQALVDWLYTDDNSVQMRQQHADTFRDRFNSLIDCTKMSSSRLSELAEVNYSYIYRLSKGERMPRPSSSALLSICTAMVDIIAERGKIPALALMTGIPEELCCGETLRSWLFGYGDYTDAKAARELIGVIERAEIAPYRNPPELPAVEETPADVYYGTEGLQNAVTCFLSSIKPGENLLLYSDEPMQWMMQNYRKKWALLMERCLRICGSMKIVHHVDRGPAEMLDAIRMWMPLYLSGKIEPFYSEAPLGERFRHTIFLCPGNAAIIGFAPVGTPCCYTYVTDPVQLAHLEKNYAALTTHCQPLLEISQELRYPTEPDALTRRFGNAEVFADQTCAIVNKRSTPRLSFRFLHPSVVSAFRTLLNP